MNYDFVQVMDLFSKIHFVFNIPYEKSLVQFMTFFEKRVYQMNCFETELTSNSQLKAAAILS